jgi:hypothetical protein
MSVWYTTINLLNWSRSRKDPGSMLRRLLQRSLDIDTLGTLIPYNLPIFIQQERGKGVIRIAVAG